MRLVLTFFSLRTMTADHIQLRPRPDARLIAAPEDARVVVCANTFHHHSIRREAVEQALASRTAQCIKAAAARVMSERP